MTADVILVMLRPVHLRWPR